MGIPVLFMDPEYLPGNFPQPILNGFHHKARSNTTNCIHQIVSVHLKLGKLRIQSQERADHWKDLAKLCTSAAEIPSVSVTE